MAKKQVVITLPGGEEVMMWEDLILIQHENERSFETNVQELLFIIQEYQKEWPIKVPVSIPLTGIHLAP